MVGQSLENLEKPGNRICVREQLENLEKSGNFNERAPNTYLHIFIIWNNAFSDKCSIMHILTVKLSHENIREFLKLLSGKPGEFLENILAKFPQPTLHSLQL